MRCTGVVAKTGKRCRWPATRIVGGLGTCEYHVSQSLELFRHVERAAQTDPMAGRAIASVYRDGIDRAIERS